MVIKKVLTQLTAFIFMVLGGIFGMLGTTVLLCWIFDGKERVIRFLTSTSDKGAGAVEWVGIILGAVLGLGLGLALWVFIMWITKWLTLEEIIKFFEGGKKGWKKGLDLHIP